MLLKIFTPLVLGGFGAFAGWWVGIAVCPDLGDIGIGAIPWAIGGAVVCGVGGVVAGVVITA